MTGVTDCPFCGFDDPAVTVYRDASIQALVSRAPINRYHVLVVPRRHVEHLADVPAEVLTDAVRVAQRVTAAIAAVARPDAITLLSDDDLTGAGFNEVAHWKLHLIPSYRGDAVIIDWRRAPDPGREVRAGYGHELRGALANA
jgi:diadenosine tetraphosphate (Ap4A) HIT family hydrolase